MHRNENTIPPSQGKWSWSYVSYQLQFALILLFLSCHSFIKNTNNRYFPPFLQVSEPCEEMLIHGTFGYEPFPCSRISKAVITHVGYCCAFSSWYTQISCSTTKPMFSMNISLIAISFIAFHIPFRKLFHVKIWNASKTLKTFIDRLYMKICRHSNGQGIFSDGLKVLRSCSGVGFSKGNSYTSQRQKVSSLWYQLCYIFIIFYRKWEIVAHRQLLIVEPLYP